MNDELSMIWRDMLKFHKRAKDDIEQKQILKETIKKLYGHRLNFPCVVVSGSKGKGSTATVVESILRSSGLRTMLFTSPHLISPLERIKINGKQISEQKFILLYKETIELLEKNKIEPQCSSGILAMMAAQLLIKNDEKIDISIIEVGIGGRLDWTKIFRANVALITHLEYDHIDFLGNSPYSIAWNKFGIITKNTTAFTIPQTRNEFQQALELLQKESGRKLNIVDPNLWKDETGLKGPTAQENTSLAVACCNYLLHEVFHKNDEEINLFLKIGAKSAIIIGRYMCFEMNGKKWFLDGAHTEDSVMLCRRWFESFNDISYQESFLLCAVSKGRKAENVLNPLCNCDWGTACYINNFECGKSKLPHNFQVFEDIEEGIQKALDSPSKFILVTGSFYLLTAVLEKLNYKIE